MKRLLIVVLVLGFAATAAVAEPLELTADQLDRITAGNHAYDGLRGRMDMDYLAEINGGTLPINGKGGNFVVEGYYPTPLHVRGNGNGGHYSYTYNGITFTFTGGKGGRSTASSGSGFGDGYTVTGHVGKGNGRCTVTGDFFTVC